MSSYTGMISTTQSFQQLILQGIPETLPEVRSFDPTVNHAPIRKDLLTVPEKKLALKIILMVISVAVILVIFGCHHHH